MTQIATVTALPASRGGMAELTVVRQTACGHSCDGCGRCAGKAPDLVIRAECGIPVEVGDKVEVFSDNKVLSAAAVVYGLPVVLFLLGYLLTGFWPEGWRYGCGGLGFALGLAAAVFADRRMKRNASLTYRVVRKL